MLTVCQVITSQAMQNAELVGTIKSKWSYLANVTGELQIRFDAKVHPRNKNLSRLEDGFLKALKLVSRFVVEGTPSLREISYDTFHGQREQLTYIAIRNTGLSSIENEIQPILHKQL